MTALKAKIGKYAASHWLLITIVFICSLSIRSSYFGRLSDGHHQWLTSSSLIYLENWIHERPDLSGFALFDAPRGVELKVPEERYPYFSYSSGSILLPYFIAKIGSYFNFKPPYLAVLMCINLLGQLVIAFCILWMARHFVSVILKPTISTNVSANLSMHFSVLMAPCFYLLSEKPLYWHQNVYFADQAIIPLFVIVGSLEFVRILKQGKSKLNLMIELLQLYILFWGLITDWFMVFAWMALIGFRCYVKYFSQSKAFHYNNNNNNSVYSSVFWHFFVPGVILPLGAASFFIWNISGEPIFQLFDSLNQLPEKLNWLIDRFQYRTSGAVQAKSDYSFLYQVFIKWLGVYDFLLLIASIGFGLFCFRKSSSLLFLLFYFIMAPLVQLITFRNHSMIHDFSVLKLVPGISIFGFFIIPNYLIQRNWSDIKSGSSELLKNIVSRLKRSIPFKINTKYSLAALLVFVFWLPQLGHFYKYFPNPNVQNQELAFEIRKLQTSSPSNLVFLSNSFSIERHPPQLLALSGKRVWKVQTISEFKDWSVGRNTSNAVFIFIQNRTDTESQLNTQWKLIRLEAQKLSSLNLAGATPLAKVFDQYGELLSEVVTSQ